VQGRALGISQEMIDLIPNIEASPLFTDEEKATVAAATELTKTAALSEATFQRLRGFFDERQLLEFVVNTSIANLNNRVTESFEAEVEPDT
jgi:alkylhydroperoxidase family enzyme